MVLFIASILQMVLIQMLLKSGSPIFLPSRIPFFILSKATAFFSFARQLHDPSTVVNAVDLSAYYGTPTTLHPHHSCTYLCVKGVRVVEVL